MVQQACAVRSAPPRLPDLQVEIVHLREIGVEAAYRRRNAVFRIHPLFLDLFRSRVEPLDHLGRAQRQGLQPFGGFGPAGGGDQRAFERGKPGGQRTRLAGRANSCAHRLQKPGARLAVRQAAVRQPTVDSTAGIDVPRDAENAHPAAAARAARLRLMLAPAIARRSWSSPRSTTRRSPHARGRRRSARDRAEAALIEIPHRQGSSARVGPRGHQRLMLVVSCSISSTVWMTLAFEE